MKELSEAFTQDGPRIAQREPSDVVVKVPAECTEGQLQTFSDLVIEGGQIAENARAGLPGRVRAARALAFLHIDGRVAGTAALKLRTDYSAGYFAKARSSLLPREFPFELGYVFVKEGYRGGRALEMARKLLPVVGNDNVFATSWVTNERMHKTLTTCGFMKEGRPFAGDDESLLLFVRRQAALAQ